MSRPKGGPRLLVTDRESALYLERARIHVEDGRVLYHISDDEFRREYNIPHVNLAVLFIGQGTSITQDAMRLLGEEGVHLAVTGTGGTPLHMGALTTYSSTEHFRQILPIYLSPERSLRAAKSVMRDRAERMRAIGATSAQRLLRRRDVSVLKRIAEQFERDLEEAKSIASLLGVEGQFSKKCYGAFAEMAGLGEDFRREAGADAASARDGRDPIGRVNRLIDHGNYLCYGLAGAALWALGVPPHLSVFHGKTRAGGLVFDIADAFKDAIVLPAAFAGGVATKDRDPEKTFRARIIDAFDDRKILKGAIATIERMIEAAGGGPHDA